MYKKKSPKIKTIKPLKTQRGSVIVSHLLIPPSKFKIPISPKKSPVSIFVSTTPLSL